MNIIPTVIEKSFNKEVAFDLYSRLLKDRIIFVSGEITDESANIIVSELLYLDSLSHDEISKYVDEFEKRLESSTRISIESIGVVLPLTGPKQSFGQKALLGIEAGLKILGIPENVKLYIKDSMDSGAQGAQSVADLIQQQKVLVK